MSKKIIFLGVIVLILIVVSIGISIIPSVINQNNSESEKIKVVSSFYPLHFFAEQIGGDRAEFKNITPQGAEPHDHEPTARDIAEIENSDLLIINGSGLESWTKNISQNINTDETVLVVAGDGIEKQTTEDDGHGHGHDSEEDHGHLEDEYHDEEDEEHHEEIIDPHFWLNPLLAKKMAGNITEGFIAADPENQNYYESNLAILLQELDELDAEFRQQLTSCSYDSIVTSHAAFGYLAAAYNLEQVPISGLSPEEEPSPQQLVEIADFVTDNGIKHIFFESLISPKLSNTIANETGANTLELNPIEGLSSQEIQEGQDYFTKMRNNLSNLKIALEC